MTRVEQGLSRRNIMLEMGTVTGYSFAEIALLMLSSSLPLAEAFQRKSGDKNSWFSASSA